MKFARWMFAALVGLGLLTGMVSTPSPIGITQTQTQQIAVYQTTVPQVSRDFVLKLAKEVFGMDKPSVGEGPEAFVLRQGGKILQVWKDSFAILFTDDDKLWNPAYKPKLASSAQEVIQQANAFLNKHNLLPPEASAFSASLHDVKDQSGAGVLNHWKVTYKFEISLQGGEKVPVVGALMEVRAGDQGEIIGLARNWRDLKPFENRPLRSVQAAVELYQQKFCKTLPIASDAAPSELLVYLMDDTLNVQKFVAPFYFLGLISATEFSPTVFIESPADGAVFAEGQTIEFKASARFGTPPYGYAWYFVVGELISQEASFSRTIPVGTHMIQLLVVDKNSMFDFGQGITVTVQPKGQPLKAARASLTVSPTQDETGKAAIIGIKNTGDLPVCVQEVTVTRPDSTKDTKPVHNTLEPGKEQKIEYPKDFPQGSVSQAGEYRVTVQPRGLPPLETKFTRIPKALVEACQALQDNRVKIAEHQATFELSFNDFVSTWIDTAQQYLQDVGSHKVPPGEAYKKAEPGFKAALAALQKAGASVDQLRGLADLMRGKFESAGQSQAVGLWLQATQSLTQLQEKYSKLLSGVKQALDDAKQGNFDKFKEFQDKQFTPLVNGVRQAGQDAKKKVDEAVKQSLKLCPSGPGP